MGKHGGTMSTEELERAINTLCLSSQFDTLYRIIKSISGSKAILISDKPAEQKRRELLRLLKKTKTQPRQRLSLFETVNQYDK
jgi:hypothetical protein